MIAAVAHIGVKKPGSSQVRAAHHDRGGLHDAALEKIRSQIERLVQRYRRHFRTADGAVRATVRRPPGYEDRLRVTPHGVELELDSFRQPFVVGIQERHEFVRPGADAGVAGG